jgi:hypothetical protein
MARRVLVAVSMLALGLAWMWVHADEPKPETPVDKADLRIKKEIDARKFREFQQALLRLAQRLEGSNKPEDRERASSIRKAIDLASTSGVDTRFDRLIVILKKDKDLNLEEVSNAMTESKMLLTDIRQILALLLSDNREDKLKAEKERLAEILKRLEGAIRKEKVNRARTEDKRTEKRDIADAERKNRKEVAQIGKALDKKEDDKDNQKSKIKTKKEDGKDGEKKDGEGKDGKNGQKKDGEGKNGQKKDGNGKDGKSGKKDGESKDGKSSKKDSESKDGKSGEKQDSKSGQKSGQPKDGESKKGQSKQGQPKDGQPNQGQQKQGQQKQGEKEDQEKQQQDNPNDPTPGRKQIQDAEKYQRQAEENIEQEKREEASKNQSKAIEELEKARKKLEEILRQLREEEIERLLAALQARCERMLQMQIAVYNGTVQVDKAFGPNPSKESEANRGNVQKALDLAKREGQIVEEADKAIQILEAEGSAVAFPEVFHQVRGDLKAVERRLGRADVGNVTQVIETDIINTLKDMIEALKKAQQDQQQRRQQQQQQQQQQSRPQDQKLIDLIQELKMIRSMQIRVNGRTKTYGEQYTGEQAAAPEIQQELGDLAERQHKIFDVTNNISKGKNK